MNSRLILMFCFLFISKLAFGQFVFKNENESVKGLQYAYMSAATTYASGKDIGAVFTVGAGLETGLTYAVYKNVNLTPRGYFHYFPNYPSESNYNDHLFLWNFGFTVSNKIPLGESGFNISPLISIGYKGGTDLVTFPVSGQESIKLLRFNGVDLSPGIMIEKNSYFIRFSYDIFLNKYKTNYSLTPDYVAMPPSKPYGPVYSPPSNKLDMNYINLTFGYHFNFFL